MENKPQFIKELHDPLEKYNVEISIGLDGDTHGLDSWLSVSHRPNPNSFKDVEILKLDNLSHHDLKPYLPKSISMATVIEGDGIRYIPNKDYFVVGPRNAWDVVNVGLFESFDDAHGAFPCSNPDIIRKATKKEIEDFFGLNQK